MPRAKKPKHRVGDGIDWTLSDLCLLLQCGKDFILSEIKKGRLRRTEYGYNCKRFTDAEVVRYRSINTP